MKYEGWVRYFDWRYFFTSFLIELDQDPTNREIQESGPEPSSSAAA